MIIHPKIAAALKFDQSSWKHRRFICPFCDREMSISDKYGNYHQPTNDTNVIHCSCPAFTICRCTNFNQKYNDPTSLKDIHTHFNTISFIIDLSQTPRLFQGGICVWAQKRIRVINFYDPINTSNLEIMDGRDPHVINLPAPIELDFTNADSIKKKVELLLTWS